MISRRSNYIIKNLLIMDVTKARPHALPLGLLLKKLVFFLLILGSSRGLLGEKPHARS